LDELGNCPSCGGPVHPAGIEARPGPGAKNLRGDAVSVAMREPRRLLEPIFS
jgi:hypothetical protein